MALADFGFTLAPDGTNASNLTTLQYLEYSDSGKEAYSASNSSANRVFLVGWANRAIFIDAILGFSYYASSSSSSSSSSGGTYTLKRYLPDEHPDIYNFFATDASVRGEGILGHQDNNAISWTVAIIEVNYKPLPYNVLTDSQITTEQDRYTTRQSSFSADYLTIQGNMQWVSRTVAQGKGLQAQPGKITGTVSLQYIWHEVPGKNAGSNNIEAFSTPNFNAITNCFGRVNSVPFDVNGINAPANTVLFIGADPKLETPKLSSGYFYWEITLSFLYRNNGIAIDGNIAGHNYVFDPVNNWWDKVTSTGTSDGTPIYQSADLNQLWTVS